MMINDFKVTAASGYLGLEIADHDVKPQDHCIDPNVAVMLARRLLDMAISEGATNVEEHFPEEA